MTFHSCQVHEIHLLIAKFFVTPTVLHNEPNWHTEVKLLKSPTTGRCIDSNCRLYPNNSYEHSATLLKARFGQSYKLVNAHM